jgi:hypothetical protein
MPKIMANAPRGTKMGMRISPCIKIIYWFKVLVFLSAPSDYCLAMQVTAFCKLFKEPVLNIGQQVKEAGYRKKLRINN